MTIGGALSELDNLLKADDIPCYYKPSIKAVMDTIALEQEPFINKPCVSAKQCEHDKNVVLDKIRAEVNKLKRFELRGKVTPLVNADSVLGIIDKHIAESEEI